MTTPGSRAPRISVVMPVYNGTHYIGQAIDSVLAQTFRDFEIVLVNDGSRDEGHTDRVCRGYADAHPGRIVYIAQENAGVGAALNTAIGAMRGELFCWLSHDDLFEPNKLERQIDFLDRLGVAQAMLFSDYRLIDADGADVAQVRLDHGEALRAPRLPLFGGWINGCTVMIPKALFPSSAPFDPRYRYVQDYRLWLALLERAELFHQPEFLVRYRTHPNQDSRRPEALAEGEALWMDMTQTPSHAARVQIAGGDRAFYERMRRHLEVSAYPLASAHAGGLRDRCEPESVVEPLPGADLFARLNDLRRVVDGGLRFATDARYFESLADPLDLSDGHLHREHPLADSPASFTTGERDWAYVASLPVERPPSALLMEVRMEAAGEDVHVRLVDEAYEALGDRQTVAAGTPHRLWFELEGLPPRLRLIVQAAESPRDSRVEIVSVALLSRDPDLPPQAAPLAT